MLYFFDNYVLDTDRRELRGNTGLVPLQPQVFDLLEYLVRQRDRVVTKDDLLDAIWGGRIVSESTLTSRINAARTAIGDRGEDQRLIRTLPRKGIRFVGAVREEDQPIGGRAAAPVIGAAAPVPPGRPLDAPPTFERRQLTVVSCDLILGAGAARMEPEDLGDLVAAYHRWIRDTVSRFNGSVGHLMGVTVLAYFGFPVAREDDAEQAVRAGLVLCAAAGEIEPRGDLRLHARIGVATGRVIIGDARDDGAGEQAPVGEAPGTASQLKNAAHPDTLLIDSSTRRLVGNLFECDEIQPINTSGTDERLRAWKVLRAGSIASRFEALHPVALTPLIGRDEEMELLVRRWQKAKSGEAQVVLISGEPGIGKSRLVTALQESLRDEPHKRLLYFCSPQHSSSAFYPIIGQLERAAQFERDDGPKVKLDKLDALLAEAGTTPQNSALLASMLGLTADGRYPHVELTPQDRRRRTLNALVEQVVALSRKIPILLIFEDLHWADPSSVEALGKVVDSIERLNALLLVTHRPELSPPWIGRSQVTAMTLNRLKRQEIDAMIQQVFRDSPLPEAIRHDIVDRADGVPLFAEEIAKAAIEAASEGVEARFVAGISRPSHSVPASLHASLMARLDRLGAAKEIAQIGASIGREFSYDLVAAVAKKEESELVASLDRLIQAGLLFLQGEPPHSTYLFKHALIQDAAYGTLLRGRRQQLHADIAGAMSIGSPSLENLQPETLAHHLTEAGLITEAVKHWLAAGKLASARSAYIEAVAHLEHGLRLITGSPDQEASRQEEFSFQVALGAALLSAKGYASGEAEQAYLRARDILDSCGETKRIEEALTGLQMVWYNQGAFANAAGAGRRMVGIAETRSDKTLSCVAHRSVASPSFMLGDFKSAVFHGRTAVADFDPELHAGLASRFGHDIGVAANVQWCTASLVVGRFAESAQARLDALGLAERSQHTNTIAYSYYYADVLPAAIVRDFSALGERARRLVDFASKNNLPQWVAWGSNFFSPSLLDAGRPEEAISASQEAIAACERLGNRAFRPLFLSYLSTALLAAGKLADSDEMFSRAIAVGNETGEQWCKTDLYICKSSLELAKGDARLAEDSLRQALETARMQGALLFELRAATRLARLWRDQDKGQQARDLLAPIRGLFGEGFDTRDLNEAKALLDELATTVFAKSGCGT